MNIRPAAQVGQSSDPFEGITWQSYFQSLGITIPQLILALNTGVFPTFSNLGSFTVSALPTGTEGAQAYATNGLKVGETPGNGTGVPVYFSTGSWRVFSTDAAVAA